MSRILVIEDSPAMQKAIRRLLEAEGFAVQIAGDGQEGAAAFSAWRPDIVILDLKLPGVGGKDLCREFKSRSPNIPIVVVSANQEVDDKVLLLELGADDYITKPFSPKEMAARVRRVLRRMQENTTPAAENRDVLEFGDVTVQFASMEVQRKGRPVPMTAQEFRILKYFADHPGKVVSREELLKDVWGYENYPSTRTVDNHILRLRQKLEADPSSPKHFLTLHGAGYKFVPAQGN